MTATNDIDRVLEGWFRADAPVSAPSDLVGAIAGATAATRRRPGWLVMDRWLPRSRQSTTVLRYAVLATLALLIAVTAVLIVGSRPKVPPPFGPARPGVFALSLDGDIVTMAADGSRRATLTTGDAWDSNPIFSRDGTKLAFWSRQPDSPASDLVVMDPEGTGRRTIARANPGYYQPGNGPVVSWAPDGAAVAYSVDPGNSSLIFVARSDGSGAAPVGNPALKGSNPAWSPDGSLIAFRGGAYDDERGLYLMRPDGSEQRRISTVDGVNGDFAATWSPDGRHLAFQTGRRLWVIGIDGSDEHLIDDASFVGAPSWSPDGSLLAWLHSSADLDAPGEFDVADADGTNVRRYPHEGVPRHGLAYDAYSPCVGWSADGKFVIGVLTSDGDVIDRLIQIDPAGGEPVVIAASGLTSWNQQRLAPVGFAMDSQRSWPRAGRGAGDPRGALSSAAAARSREPTLDARDRRDRGHRVHGLRWRPRLADTHAAGTSRNRGAGIGIGHPKCSA